VSADLEARLTELRAERDAVAARRTREDAAERARSWLDGARARAAESAGLVANGHATGEALQTVLAAFVLADPRLPAWLTAGQEALVGGLTEHAKRAMLKKLGAEITKAEGELREIRKADAIARVEAEFAGEAA
jgi:hypothetical protein